MLPRIFPEADLIDHGPWIRFEDSNGYGFAQPDYLVFDNGRLWVVECKLSHVDVVEKQLCGLYGPLLAELHQEEELILVEACSNLTPRGGRRRPHVRQLGQVLEAAPKSYHIWYQM